MHNSALTRFAQRGYIDALAAAGCRMAFIGMESLSPASLNYVQKRQNNVGYTAKRSRNCTASAIPTFTGLMFALDEDT